jgi:tetratricopeptide (TPR) repeat protein
MAPTWPEENPMAIRVQDIMILQILEQNQWKRPVYFAVTVAQNNMIGLHRYLRMDGLGYQVMPYPVDEPIHPEKLQNNLLNKFRYTNLNNPQIHFNTNIVKLLQNYRSAYIQLARYYIDQGQYAQADSILKDMDTKLPAQVIPYSNTRLAAIVGELYKRVGRGEEANRQFDYVLKGIYMSPIEQTIQRTQEAIMMQDWDQAEGILIRFIQQNPGNVEAISELLRLYQISKQYQKGITLLESWLQRNPKDNVARALLSSFQEMAAGDTVTRGIQAPQ